MLFRILLWAFIIGMVLRFLTRFVFPILKITRVTQDRLRQMQQQMEDMQKQQQGSPANTVRPKQTVKEGEYIEYEDLK